MKKNILFWALLMSTTIFAQVGIGTPTPHSSSVLELKSDNAGLILPRLKTTDIQDPQMGTIVYDTEKNQICVFTTTWNCYSNSVGAPAPGSALATNTEFKQSAFLDLNGTVIYGNALKNQGKTIAPTTSIVTPFVSPCVGNCDSSNYGMVNPGSHVLGFTLRRGNATVAGNYVVIRVLVDNVVVNEETFNFSNGMNSGDKLPYQFEFTCSSPAKIQIQAGNNLNDASIQFDYLQTKNSFGV